MRAKREGLDRKNFCDLYFVERLNDVEVKVFGLVSVEANSNINEIDIRIEQSIENTLMEMINFANDIIHNSLLSNNNNTNIKLEFTRIDRNKLIKRLVLCLKYFVVSNKILLRRLEIIALLVQCINSLFDIYNKLSMMNNVLLLQYKEEMNSEISLLIETTQLLRYLLTRYLIYRQDVTTCFFHCITFCVQSVEEYNELCDHGYKTKANTILTLISKLLIEDVIVKTLYEGEHMPRDLVAQSIDCLLNCIQLGPSLFGTLFCNNFYNRFHYILQTLLSKEEAIDVKNLVGECWAESSMKFLSTLHAILSVCIINFEKPVTIMAEFTLCLMNNYWDITTMHLDNIGPFLFVYELSKKTTPLYDLFFIPSNISVIIASLQFWMMHHYRHGMTPSLVHLIQKWMEIYCDHLISTKNIHNLVNDMLQSTLIQTIFSLLGKKDLPQEMHTSIMTLLSFMISSLNSNDIYNIHMLSDFLSSKVVAPFLSLNVLENEKENVRLMTTRLLEEKRLLPLLVENQLQKHLERLLGAEVENVVDSELRSLLYTTEKELSHMKTMLKMLPHEEQQLLQITEGIQFRKALEETK
ncbi:hypothetical protein C9374_009544 [Naegleria lovaniensis]|uniref:Uncharacterized protein n=1 Tax=Naegleria lovaniensis TaxID=51637 RepID=A0AA88H4Z8_NAELO|nr:uncharacterized protein C9374_009544 [Naegleria lovaniensis]KAG2392967.1 hypothetical protein C9374_009544 [Naegleria lovaniensis]